MFLRWFRARRSRRERVCLICIVPILAACPPDDTADGVGGSETGEAGVPVAIDPFNGGGDAPPGPGNRNSTWRAPAAIGNGLVHDSRYELGGGPRHAVFTAAELDAGVDWTDFVDEYAVKLERGFRPAQLDALHELTQVNGGFELSINDRTVYVSDDDANYSTQTLTYVFPTHAHERNALVDQGSASPGEARPTAIDTFSFPSGQVGTSIAWTYDDNPLPWRIVTGFHARRFNDIVTQYRNAQFRPISIASRTRNGEHEYAAIFVNDGMSAADWELSVGLDLADFEAEAQAKWNAGYYPVRIDYEQGSDNHPRIDVLWTKQSPELAVQLRYNMDDRSFEAEDIDWRKQGYHLESAAQYVVGGETRYTGVWVRHEPYLRVTRENLGIDESSPAFIAAYSAKYVLFHNRAIQAMTLGSGSRAGEFYRPAATLHIFEGDQLVVSRAYTYGPAIYPETQVGAPMGLASASKSITAAAVVRELAGGGSR